MTFFLLLYNFDAIAFPTPLPIQIFLPNEVKLIFIAIKYICVVIIQYNQNCWQNTFNALNCNL